jgi:hypothetical protein
MIDTRLICAALDLVGEPQTNQAQNDVWLVETPGADPGSLACHASVSIRDHHVPVKMVADPVSNLALRLMRPAWSPDHLSATNTIQQHVLKSLH